MTTLNKLISVVALMLTSIALSPLVRCQPASAGRQTSATLKGDPAHPAHGQHWVDTRLYFGLGPADVPDKGVPEAAWRDFLDKEVTPRFPAGLSVIDVYGQWQGKQQKTPERIRTKLLIIDYPATPENAARIEAIRVAWKQKTGDQSVMKVTEPADVSF
ncbi:MAG TPA: DUF3574 domain-containing protein [Acidobacteriaceae bacterium]